MRLPLSRWLHTSVPVGLAAPSRPAASFGLRRSGRACLAAALFAGCAASDGGPDAGARSATLVQADVVFSSDARGVHLSSQAWFARMRPDAVGRAATLLGVGHDDEIALDSCVLVDGAAELDRAFRGDVATGVQLLDAGRLQLRGPSDATTLSRRRYPDLTPEVAGVVYGADDSSRLSLETGATYTLVGEGAEDVGAFATSVAAPRAFPTIDAAVQHRGGDLELRWAEAGEVSDPLLVTVSSGGTRQVRCRVRDDGSFTVGRSLLAELPAAAPAGAAGSG